MVATEATIKAAAAPPAAPAPTAVPASVVRPTGTLQTSPTLVERKSHLASFIAIGGAVAAMAAGGALTLHANSASDDLRNNVYPADQANTLQARIDNDRSIAKVLFVVSGVFAVSAIPLWRF